MNDIYLSSKRHTILFLYVRVIDKVFIKKVISFTHNVEKYKSYLQYGILYL